MTPEAIEQAARADRDAHPLTEANLLWEQGRAEPDQPTRAYLMLIARDPGHVNRILNPGPH